MNTEEIIEMARKIATQASKAGPYQTWTHEYAMSLIMQLVEASAAKEREACADICERFQARDVGMQPAECAGAIRARGEA